MWRNKIAYNGYWERVRDRERLTERERQCSENSVNVICVVENKTYEPVDEWWREKLIVSWRVQNKREMEQSRKRTGRVREKEGLRGGEERRINKLMWLLPENVSSSWLGRCVCNRWCYLLSRLKCNEDADNSYSWTESVRLHCCSCSRIRITTFYVHYRPSAIPPAHSNIASVFVFHSCSRSPASIDIHTHSLCHSNSCSPEDDHY